MSIPNTVAEDAEIVTTFIQKCIAKINASKIGTMITDNASTMTCVWRKIVDDPLTCGDCSHIHFLSCVAHMLHNYSREILTETKYRKEFAFIKHVLSLLRNREFRQIVQDRSIIGFIPSHTPIRWGSGSLLTEFFENHNQDIKDFIEEHYPNDKFVFDKVNQGLTVALMNDYKLQCSSLNGLMCSLIKSIRS